MRKSVQQVRTFKDRGIDRIEAIFRIDRIHLWFLGQTLKHTKMHKLAPLVVCFYEAWSEKLFHVVYNVPVWKG